MTARDFREIALSFPEAVESAHMRHPDFRVGGRIFATLGYPDEEWGTIKSTPEERRKFVQVNPEMFRPVKGAWYRRKGSWARRKRFARRDAKLIRKSDIFQW